MLFRRLFNFVRNQLDYRKATVVFLLAIGCVVLLMGAARSEELTDWDYRYLAKEFGLKRDGAFLQNLGQGEKANLHAVINDPAFDDVPRSRDANVADVLFQLQIRTCDGKPKKPEEVCPQELGTLPGKKVAADHCFVCHLTGTMEARSFYKLSRDGTWNEKRLAAVLASGHKMSPVTLSSQEFQQLTEYIRSLSR